MEREISISVSKESDHGRLQQSNLTPIRQFFHSHPFPTGRKEDEETVEEFCKQSTELKKNTNNIDLYEDKLSREKKTCV